MPPDGSTRVNEPRGRLIALSPNTQAVHSRRDVAERRIEQTHCWIICALSLIVGGGRRYRVRCLPNAVEMRASEVVSVGAMKPGAAEELPVGTSIAVHHSLPFYSVAALSASTRC